VRATATRNNLLHLALHNGQSDDFVGGQQNVTCIVRYATVVVTLFWARSGMSILD